MKPKSILVVVTSHDRISDGNSTGIWFEEFAVPLEILKKEDLNFTVASIKGGRAPIDPRSMPAEAEQTGWTKDALILLMDTQKLDEVDLDAYDAIFFPGGHGTMFDLPVNNRISQSVAHFIQSDRIVAAVCHGPAALVGAKLSDGTALVKGRRLTGFTNNEERSAELDKMMPFLLQTRLTELGADFIESPNWHDNVVTDGKLITGQNPQSSAGTAHAIVKALQA